MQPKSLEIYLYPGTEVINPYMVLLREALQKVDPNATILPEAIETLSPRCIRKDLSRRIIIHAHWLPECYPAHWIRAVGCYGKITAHFLTMSLMKLRCGAKVIWTVHHANVGHLKPFWTSLFWRWLVWLSDAYIFHCTQSEKDFFRTYQRKPSFVIPHGHFTDAYGPPVPNQKSARSKLGLPQNTKIFLILGVIRESKNLDLLLTKLKGLESNGVSFLIAGRPMMKEWPQVRRRYNTDPRFIFRDDFIPHKDLPHFFAAADYLINGQERGYASGITVAALSYGLPTLQLNWGCASTIIRHGINGLLFDWNALHHAVTQALEIREDETRYRQMRRSAIEIMQQYDWDAIAKQTLLAYQEVLAIHAS
ncbi:MAG: glycosyltransferase family 4 protein [Parcubacteria group bacterium]|nr:glycosyltransferase family 4 protein [Parcubacteria group bacterium]